MRIGKRLLALLCTAALLLSLVGTAFAKETDAEYAAEDTSASDTQAGAEEEPVPVPDALNGAEDLVDLMSLQLMGADDVVFNADRTILISYPASKTDASYTVPNTVTEIADAAFYNSKLTAITLPDGLTTIGHQAFRDSAKLEVINLPASVTGVGIGSGTNRADIFWGCGNLRSVTIGMERVPKGLFYLSSKLENVTLQNTVKVIGEEAFYSCDALTSVTLPALVTDIEDSAFSNCDSLVTVTLNEGLKTIGASAFSDCEGLDFPAIPSSVESLGAKVFAGLSIETLTPNMFPPTLTALPDGVFSGCESLLSVELPGTITGLGESAFSYCTTLTSVKIPDSVTAIKDYTFIGCTELTEVTLGDNIATIGTGAFSNCDSLRGIILPSKLTDLGKSAFSSCDVLESIDLPDGVKKIGSYTFEHCAALASVNLPNTLETVDAGAFEQCRVLTSLTFPATLETLSSTNVFSWTPALRDVTFLGDAPKNQDNEPYTTSNPFGANGGEDTGHSENLTVYYPAGNTSYIDWAMWTFPAVKPSDNKPSITQTIPATVALSAVLEHDRQDCLVLWYTVDVTHAPHPDDPTLAPSGNLQYFINGVQVFPDHMMGVGTALHKITGINIKQYLGKEEEITVQVKLLASEGFAASESIKLTGKVVMPAWDKQLPFVPGGPGPITPESQYETKPNADNTGVVITKILEPAASSPEVVLPATLGDEPVTGLGKDLFAGNVFAAYVTVPVGVKTLETGVFKDCSHLRIVSLPSGITTLPADTFSGCAGLSSVNIPGTVTTIGANAFKDCAKLPVLTFPAVLATLDKDALSGCDLKAAVFEGNAPTFTGGVPAAFGPETILYTEPGATGFTVSPWKEMRREPVALGLDFDAVYVPDTKSMLVTVEFDTTAYGPDAPAPDVSKVVVRINNFHMTDGVTVNADKTISVPVPAQYDGQDAFVNIRYPGDWYYREVISQSKTEILPYTQENLTITNATSAQAAVNLNKTITLTIVPKFNETVYKPKLAKLAVTLNGTVVTDFTVDDKTGGLSIDVTALAGDTVPLTLSYPGDYHLNLSNTYTVDVVIPSIPVDPPPAPVVTLTASAAAVVEEGGSYFLPLTATLSIANATGPIDRAKLSVKLNGSAATVTAGIGDILNVLIDEAILGSVAKVDVHYEGQPDLLYTGADFSLSAVRLADPNPPKANTTLTAAPNGFVWNMSPAWGHCLSLTAKLEHTPYRGDNTLVPNRSGATVTVDGKSVSNFSWSDSSITIQVGSELYNKTVDVVIIYPGDDHFNPSSKTLSVLITPPSSGNSGSEGSGGSGGSTSTPKPSTGENAKVTVSSKDATEAVKAAADSGSVVLKADTAEDAKSVAVTVPASVMKAIAKAEAPVSIQSPVADLILDTKVLETLQRNGAKDVVVSAGAADTAALPKAAQTALTGRPVYDISITAGGKTVSQFNGGSVTVALPYTLAAGESADKLTVCWVKDDGTTEVLCNSAYKNGKLTFSTPHLSTYAILHAEVDFLDVSEDSWAKSDIDFVIARGVLKGMGDDGGGGELFGPSVTLTGTMAVVALARMDGVADGTGDDWAAPALSWAKEQEILPEGFIADKAVTREQFAYMVAGYLGGAKPVSLPAYLDIEQSMSSCVDSIYYLSSLDVMNGTGDGCFSPKLSLTRSELAAILHRLVMLQLG